MAQIVKVRCNGPNPHINDVDLDDALGTGSIATIARSMSSPSYLPERVVLLCHECTEGKVILTRRMIEDARERNSLG